MKVAIIQPYLFPYIGYFQLIYAADIFIFLDNVQYIKRGWINRNRIRSKTAPIFFSVPLKKGNQRSLISQRFIAEQFWKRFHYKFFLSLHHHYSKADHYAEIVSLIKKVIEIQEHRISRLSEESIRKVCDYLEIQARFYRASDMINDKVSQSLSVNARLIELTKIAGGHSYINPIAGQHLYQPDDFSAAGVELYFLSAIETDYKQGATENFIPSLSIIDLLMHNNKKTIINMLSQAKVIKASTLS